MPNPKVSIIVPIYNQNDRISRCLDSITSQTLHEMEIICINDGSTDDSLDMIRRYQQQDQRITIIDKENTGYGHSINLGMEQAVGEYVAIVEPDDVIENDMMESLYSIAKRDDLDWVKGDIFLCSSNGSRRESITCGQDIYNMVLDPQTDIHPHRSELRTWAGIYKTSFIRDNDIKHNETPGASYQDMGFMLQTLYYAHRVEFVDQAYYRWTVDNPNSSINVDSKKMFDKHIIEFNLDKEYILQHPELTKIAKGSFYYRLSCSSVWLMDQLDIEEKREFIEYFRKEMIFAYEKGLIVSDMFTTRQRMGLERRVLGIRGMTRMEMKRLFGFK